MDSHMDILHKASGLAATGLSTTKTLPFRFSGARPDAYIEREHNKKIDSGNTKNLAIIVEAYKQAGPENKKKMKAQTQTPGGAKEWANFLRKLKKIPPSKIISSPIPEKPESSDLSSLLARLGIGTGSGAVVGGLLGAGSAKTSEERFGSTVKGVGLGAVVGLALASMKPIGTRVIKAWSK